MVRNIFGCRSSGISLWTQREYVKLLKIYNMETANTTNSETNEILPLTDS
jgi:hypothetical protein